MNRDLIIEFNSKQPIRMLRSWANEESTKHCSPLGGPARGLEKTTFAGLFDTLLPTNCAKNGAVEKEFMQLYGNYSQSLHANNVMPRDTSGVNALAQYRLWVAKWKREFSSSTDSPTDHIATLSFCDPMQCFPK
jgi:hypothetical protein